jgi:hypothetical protein
MSDIQVSDSDRNGMSAMPSRRFMIFFKIATCSSVEALERSIYGD